VTRLLLLRHTEVAAHWRGRCYGRAEAGLSRAGLAEARRIASALPPDGITRVVSSPARRARVLAARIARRLGLKLEIEPRLAERDFGAWEGQAWDAIWQAEGSSMDGMIDAPDRFRPGGGETTCELAARALSWLDTLPPGGGVLAVAHGGPIAALVGSLRGEAPRAWLAHVPRVGEAVVLSQGPDGWVPADPGQPGGVGGVAA
jgi:broad specificity phosphatase PhoE